MQAFLDLKHERFVHFWHSAYVKNDAASAGEGLEQLRRGDLFIRDLGFFVLPVLERLSDQGIQWLSRWKSDSSVFDLGGHPLDMVQLLRDRHSLDRQVRLGQKERLRVRLVALKVPEAVADERRRKVRRHHGYLPTKKHCWLLGWNIYVTNVSRDLWSTEQVARVYGLRWRMETTFKAWKQHFKLEDVPVGSPVQVEVLLYARLLFISLFEVNYLARWDYLIQQKPHSRQPLETGRAHAPLSLGETAPVPAPVGMRPRKTNWLPLHLRKAKTQTLRCHARVKLTRMP